jgi:hypothetical protein
MSSAYKFVVSTQGCLLCCFVQQTLLLEDNRPWCLQETWTLDSWQRLGHMSSNFVTMLRDLRSFPWWGLWYAGSWHRAACLTCGYWRFRGTFHFHLQCRSEDGGPRLFRNLVNFLSDTASLPRRSWLYYNEDLKYIYLYCPFWQTNPNSLLRPLLFFVL